MSAPVYVHPKTIEEFEKIYQNEYEQELEACDKWISWCTDQKDYYGTNFYQGQRAATIHNNIKMCQLIRILKKESPNA